MSSDLAFTIAMFTGWLAILVWILWPTGHLCHDDYCPRKQRPDV